MFLYEPVHINTDYNLSTLKYPISIYFKVTTKCMLKCIFCSQSEEGEMEMDFEFAKKQLKKFCKMGISYIYYTGGEPLLYPHILQLVQYGHSLGMKQVLITNGILLFDINLEHCLEYIVAIGISLHGSELIHNRMSGGINCWKKVVKNLYSVREKYPNLKIDINCTVLKDNANIDNFIGLMNIAEEINATLCFSRLNYVANGKKFDVKHNINDFLCLVNDLNMSRLRISNCITPCVVDKKYKHLLHGCGAGVSSAALDPNGDIKICATSQIPIGNLKYASFFSIWNNHNLKKYRKFKWIPKTCAVCKDLTTCKTGCHSEGSQLFWNECCDELMVYKMQEVWNKIAQKRIRLKQTEIRREYIDRYILLGFPARKINQHTYNLLMLLDGTYTGNQILDLHMGNSEVKDLLIALMNDRNIEVE